MLERLMLDGVLPPSYARIATNLQRAEALAQAESTRDIVMQLQQSLTQLASIQQLLQLHVQWTPEQARRQQQRLVRQQARLQWQKTILERQRRDSSSG